MFELTIKLDSVDNFIKLIDIIRGQDPEEINKEIHKLDVESTKLDEAIQGAKQNDS